MICLSLIFDAKNGWIRIHKRNKENDKFINTPCVAVITLTMKKTEQKQKVGFDAYEIKIHKDKLIETVTIY